MTDSSVPGPVPRDEDGSEQGDRRSEPNSEPSSGLGPGAVAFLTLGLSAAVVLVICGGLGYLVDRWLNTSPAFTLVGVALGIATVVAMTVTRVRKYLH